MSPKQKFQLALGVIVVLVATGTLGYKFFLPEQTWFDCFYFTLITITTIGYGEPKDMTEPARYFTAFLILTGVSSIGSFRGVWVTFHNRGVPSNPADARRWPSGLKATPTMVLVGPSKGGNALPLARSHTVSFAPPRAGLAKTPPAARRVPSGL